MPLRSFGDGCASSSSISLFVSTCGPFLATLSFGISRAGLCSAAPTEIKYWYSPRRADSERLTELADSPLRSRYCLYDDTSDASTPSKDAMPNSSA